MKKNILYIVILAGMIALFFLAMNGHAQTAPPVSLGGSIGVTGGQSLTGMSALVIGDADHTLTPNEWWPMTLKVASSVSLTATRHIVAPLNSGQIYNVENLTTGGQSITIGGASGSAVSIPNGSAVTVFSDGTNYTSPNSGGCGLSANCTWTGTHTWGSNQNGVVISPSGTGGVQGWNTSGINTWQIGNAGGVAQFGDIFASIPSAATSGSNFSSPTLNVQANYWGGLTSQADVWFWQAVLGTGTNPTTTYTLTHSGSPGNAVVSVPYPMTTGDINAVGDVHGASVSSDSSVAAGTVVTGQQGVSAIETSGASSGSNVNSSALAAQAAYWNGSISTHDVYSWTNVIGAGANPSSVYTLTHSGASGGAALDVSAVPTKLGNLINSVGFQVVSTPSCVPSSPLMSCALTVNLLVTEPDTNYTAQCSGQNIPGSGVVVGNIISMTTTSFVAGVYVVDASPLTSGTIVCYVVHN